MTTVNCYNRKTATLTDKRFIMEPDPPGAYKLVDYPCWVCDKPIKLGQEGCVVQIHKGQDKTIQDLIHATCADYQEPETKECYYCKRDVHRTDPNAIRFPTGVVAHSGCYRSLPAAAMRMARHKKQREEPC